MLCIVTERPADPLMTPSVRYTEMGKAYLKKFINNNFKSRMDYFGDTDTARSCECNM